jgi:hypothetical protein
MLQGLLITQSAFALSSGLIFDRMDADKVQFVRIYTHPHSPLICKTKTTSAASKDKEKYLCRAQALSTRHCHYVKLCKSQSHPSTW